MLVRERMTRDPDDRAGENLARAVEKFPSRGRYPNGCRTEAIVQSSPVRKFFT